MSYAPTCCLSTAHGPIRNVLFAVNWARLIGNCRHPNRSGVGSNGVRGTSRKVTDHRPIRCRRRLPRDLRNRRRTRARIRSRGTLEQIDIGLLRAGLRSAALRDLWKARRQRAGTPAPSASRGGPRTARATAERSATNSSSARAGAHAPRRRLMGGRTQDGCPSKIALQVVDASFDGASSTTLRFD
jgi:hypothetical protein